jgi:hypothetical protein
MEQGLGGFAPIERVSPRVGRDRQEAMCATHRANPGPKLIAR